MNILNASNTEAYRQLNPEHSYPKVDLFRATYQSMQHQQSIRKEQA
jgi:hypothetical protein